MSWDLGARTRLHANQSRALKDYIGLRVSLKSLAAAGQDTSRTANPTLCRTMHSQNGHWGSGGVKMSGHREYCGEAGVESLLSNLLLSHTQHSADILRGRRRLCGHTHNRCGKRQKCSTPATSAGDVVGITLFLIPDRIPRPLIFVGPLVILKTVQGPWRRSRRRRAGRGTK